MIFKAKFVLYCVHLFQNSVSVKVVVLAGRLSATLHEGMGRRRNRKWLRETTYSDVTVLVSGFRKPNAIESFEGAGLQPILVENVTKSGYGKPTPLQKNVIPVVMASRDLMVACPQTSSGKSSTFLLPIIHRLIEADAGSGDDGPQCIVVAPTRWLALQIHNEACAFAQGSLVRSVVAYEGISPVRELPRGCNILVATPDKLLDLVEKGRVTLSNCKYLVLEEADRMWDMDFMSEIQKLVENPHMPKKAPKGKRQTLIFSASLPDELQESAREFLAEDYLFISVGVR